MKFFCLVVSFAHKKVAFELSSKIVDIPSIPIRYYLQTKQFSMIHLLTDYQVDNIKQRKNIIIFRIKCFYTPVDSISQHCNVQTGLRKFVCFLKNKADSEFMWVKGKQLAKKVLLCGGIRINQSITTIRTMKRTVLVDQQSLIHQECLL